MFRSLPAIAILLYVVALLDELASGAPTMGAPDIQRAFAQTHASTTLVIFVVPAIVGFVVDPIVFLYSDRHPRKWFVAGGLGVMAVAAFLAALAPNAATLAGAIACWYVAAGASAALSQATLVDRAPEHRARTMTRWTLLAAIGDLLAPIAVGGLAMLVGSVSRASRGTIIRLHARRQRAGPRAHIRRSVVGTG